MIARSNMFPMGEGGGGIKDIKNFLYQCLYCGFHCFYRGTTIFFTNMKAYLIYKRKPIEIIFMVLRRRNTDFFQDH